MTPEDRRREMDELAGVVTIVKRGPGRPRKVDLSLLPQPKTEEKDEDGEPLPDMSFKTAHLANSGLPVRWYAHAFGLTENNVKSRLRGVAPVNFGKHGNPLYAMKDAAPCLVEPKIDLREHLRSIKDDDLPDDLRLKLWQARRARNRVMMEEGELWHSSEVLARFSEYLLSIREKLQLIPDKLERMTGITPDQYKLIRAVVDGVQVEMYEDALKMGDADNTLPLSGADDAEEVVL